MAWQWHRPFMRHAAQDEGCLDEWHGSGAGLVMRGAAAAAVMLDTKTARVGKKDGTARQWCKGLRRQAMVAGAMPDTCSRSEDSYRRVFVD
eukprot:1146291-Pelagomonas_calceolata.AAC.3